jgi:class 3 adenylate cyclase/predicted ATPase
MNPDGQKFCGECGAKISPYKSEGLHVAAPANPSLRPNTSTFRRTAPDSERRIATVMFADLTGFTGISEKLDPEEVAELVGGIFKRFEPIIASYGGHVDKYIGDAVMVVFGVPMAHEDDPTRAIHCALEMNNALSGFNRHQGLTLTMRTGINTGEVSAGRPTETGAYTVLGDAVNIAQRLQTLAEPGKVVVGRATQKLADSTFSFRRLPATQVKGREEPVQPFEVSGLLQPSRRFQKHAHASAEMVGRDTELARLKGVFRDARDNSSCRCAFVLGEAGIGKSRLLYEFDQWAIDEPYVIKMMSGRCAPYGASPLLPFKQIVDAMCGIKLGMGEDEARELLLNNVSRELSTLLQSGRVSGPAEVVNLTHLIGMVTGVQFPGSPVLGMPPEHLREEGYRAATLLVEAFASRGPVVIMLEDFQYADESTVAILMHLNGRLAKMPVMFIAGARTEIESSPFAGRLLSMPRTEVIGLKELGRDDVKALVSRIMPGNPIDAIQDVVAERAAGNPLFVEEVIRLMAEQRARPAPTATAATTDRAPVVPESLEGLLGARIDGLPQEERDTLLCASVIGRVFWKQAVEELGDAKITTELDSLKARDITVEHAESMLDGEAEHAFRHSLMRDAAYRRLPKKERRILHARLTDWIERRLHLSPQGTGSGRKLAAIELLTLAAYHNANAGRAERASSYWEDAGDAARVSAHLHEAVAYFSEALNLTPKDEPRKEDTLARLLYKRADARKISGQLDEAVEDYTQGLRHAKDRTSRVAFIRGASSCRSIQTRMDEADRLLSEALREVEGTNTLDEATVLFSQGMTEIRMRTNLTKGEDILRRALTILKTQPDDHSGPSFAPHEKNVMVAQCLNMLGVVARNRGEYQQAEEHHLAALRLLEQSGEIHELAHTYGNLGSVCHAREQHEAALEYHTKNLGILESIGDTNGISGVLCNMGGIYQRKCDHDRALELFERALKLATEVGNKLFAAICMVNTGMVHEARGDKAKALDLFTKYLAISEEIGYKRGIAIACSRIGGLHERNQDPTMALEFYERQLNTAREIGLKPIIAEAIGNIGKVHLYLGDLDRALEMENEYLRISLEIHFVYGMGNAYQSLAEVHWEQDRLGPAMECVTKALDVHRKSGTKDTLLGDLRTLAKILLASDRPVEAEKACDEALSIAREMKIPRKTVDAINLKGIALRHQKRIPEALALHNEALNMARGGSMAETRICDALAGVISAAIEGGLRQTADTAMEEIKMLVASGQAARTKLEDIEAEYELKFGDRAKGEAAIRDIAARLRAKGLLRMARRTEEKLRG